MGWYMCLAVVVMMCVAGMGEDAEGAVGGPGSAARPEDFAVLKTLRAGHPRLVALEEDIERVRRLIAGHEQARQWHRALVKKAEGLLAEPVLEYTLVGPRLLGISRAACDRIYTLGLLYRLDGDRRYAERGIKELLAISGFADWHPAHFLDTAEMMHAAAIGYDWFHDRLSGEQRDIVRRAIVEKGLQPTAAAYQGSLDGWWVVSRHNWNQVCNGGAVIGALAVAEEELRLAAFVLNGAFRTLPQALEEYAPEGGCAEGPGYWSYATQYTACLLAALNSALGDDRGFSKMPGFDRTGDFRTYFVGPTGRVFNYADAGEGAGAPPEMFWLARRFDKPIYAWHERQQSYDGNPLSLLWFDPRGEGPRRMGLALDRWFRGIDVVFMRSAWEDPQAVFVGFKAGDNKANHSHLDLGTFVLDALGERWALDLGEMTTTCRSTSA